MNDTILAFSEIKQIYPDQWVLIANPELSNPEILGSVVSKLLAGIVLLASKDKREIGYKGRDLRKNYKDVTCVYTGEIPQNKKWLL